MFPLLSVWTYEAGFPSEARILGFWDDIVPVISGTGADAVCSFLPPSWAKETSISFRVWHKHLPCHRKAREARVWVEVGDRAHKPGLQGPRGISTQLYNRLSQRISSYTGYVSAISPMGVEVETLKKPLYLSSPLGTRICGSDMSGLRVRDLRDSTHCGPEGHGHVRV